MSESIAHVDLSALTVEFDDEALPTLAVGGKTAEPPVQAYRDAIRQSHELHAAGKLEKPPRFMIPVERKEISVRESKRVDKAGVEHITRWEQHPNLTGTINRLRKAADAEGLGVRIVVDYDRSTGKLKVNKGKDGQPDTVRLRFVGTKRKTRKTATAETPKDSQDGYRRDADTGSRVSG